MVFQKGNKYGKFPIGNKYGKSNKGRKRPDLALYNKLHPKKGKNHPLYGKPRTKVVKDKISKKKTGKPNLLGRKFLLSKEKLYNLYHKEKLSSIKIAKKLNICNSTICRWLIKYNIPIRSMSENSKGRFGPLNNFYGKKHTTETLKKIKLFQKGMIPHNKGKKMPIKSRMKSSKSHKEIYKDPKMRILVGKRSKKLWSNKSYREKTIKAILKGLMKRPTSLEKTFIGLIKKYKLPYKYVGDGAFLIGYKNPDFINTNGEKICVEVANRYHHPDPWAENRIKHFTKWGWECLIFFEDQFDEELILKKISRL